MNVKIGNLFKGDKCIWAVLFCLTVVSVIEVFSASSTLSYKSQNFMGPLFYHVMMIFIGIVVALITVNIPCKYFKLITPLMLLLSFVTLLCVLAFGESINGANRVIQLPGFTFQPSELAKGTLVLATAQILSAMQREDGSGADDKAMKYVLFISIPMILLISIENLSTGALLFAVIYIMMILGRVPRQQMTKLTGFLVLCVGLVLALIFTFGIENNDNDSQKQTTEVVASAAGTAVSTKAAEPVAQEKESEGVFEKIFHRFGTWKSRLTSSGKPDDPKEYNLKDNFQVAHANIAIASSGVIGKGPGNSLERDYLPQAFSDFIFAIIIEEWGLVGAIFVVVLYLLLLYRTAHIARLCQNNFPAFLVMGLAMLLVIQATINMMVAVDFGIVTGQPLPLVSKGGTSTIINCAYIGAILSVSRSAKRIEEDHKKAKA